AYGAGRDTGEGSEIDAGICGAVDGGRTGDRGRGGGRGRPMAALPTISSSAGRTAAAGRGRRAAGAGRADCCRGSGAAGRAGGPDDDVAGGVVGTPQTVSGLPSTLPDGRGSATEPRGIERRKLRSPRALAGGGSLGAPYQ